MTVLKIGSNGDEVKKIQKFLGLKEDGDFGKITDAAVKKWQKEHGLLDDGVVGEKTWNAMFTSKTVVNEDRASLKPGQVDASVTYDPITVHISKKARKKIDYLVIHFTAGGSSKKGSAQGTRKVFLNRSASADFATDDVCMLQINPDINKYYCWAVGDGKGKYGVTNSNSISIEMCSNLKKGTTAKVANHEGWYFTEETIDNTIKLCIILMKKFNIPLNKVIRHNDASGKLCPGLVGWNNGSIYDATTGAKTTKKNDDSEWRKFKQKLEEKLSKS